MSRRGIRRLAGLSAAAAAGVLALPGVASADVNASVSGGKLTVESTDGPLEHVKVVCSGGHWFTPLASEVEMIGAAEAA